MNANIKMLIDQKKAAALEEILSTDTADLGEEDLLLCAKLEMQGVHIRYGNADNDQVSMHEIEESYVIDCTRINQLAWQELINRHNSSLPILPLHDLIVYPSATVLLTIDGESPSQMINTVWAGPIHTMGLSLRKGGKTEPPDPADIHSIGTLAEITHVVSLPGGQMRVMVKGLHRIKIENIKTRGPFLRGEIQILQEPPFMERKSAKMLDGMRKALFVLVQKLEEEYLWESVNRIADEPDPHEFIYLAANFLLDSFEGDSRMQELLELDACHKQLVKINELFTEKYGRAGYKLLGARK